MNVKYFSKALAMLLAVVMIAGLLPMNAFAALVDYESRDDEYYNLISKQDWELAPGVVESEIVLNNDAGSHRQVAHVVEVDINNPYTKVMPSTYKMAEGSPAFWILPPRWRSISPSAGPWALSCFLRM